ncbi:MAG: 30S ribosomal protein S8 [Candidatus Eisenbacteria bacterium]|jgi:small subunit ribosomal protein S8|uniref:Small ribosomal subunit protein uS8 n=1 Tax=Eiseniibacteriota bacterium TaxID=2212470 RepID=A0A538TRV9_UNCEI|nr:MAG: 30S ribosomal protein S8 [Candidatus Eisenbacteria bacterium]
MSVSDPIADLLTCIRNACKAKHKKVDVPTSKTKAEVVRVLLREKYINNYKSIDDKKRGLLRIYLKYDQKDRPVIQGIERVSKPGRRVYIRRHEVPKVQGGLGTALISTPSGIMTDQEARDEGLGGEYLCRLW